MKTRVANLPVLYFGTPVALVSSVNPDGTTNLSPISSYWALSDTLVLGLSTTGQCFGNLSRCPEIVLNLPDASLWANVESIAATTGAEIVPDDKKRMGYRFEHNKFQRAGLTAKASESVIASRVAECPIQIEARLTRMHAIGSDEDEMVAAECKATRVHVHADLLTSAGRVELDRWRPLYYVFRHYYTLGAYLGKTFRA
ncbi:flavin reductase family protein [Trinickia fusca]|uniref:Flavin reductase family protein n=1 Tax=Trinickia fusca TaxID=2419777 RepID=A0A494X5S0_9BURK|nr:flavin reductase family protein [Trinickia fusca]RKP46027.1 flavin reductase family protein [Trinickia fusca]